ncbi:hypothetical protein BG846_04928 [Streptomyces fradiae ATCC 10745 = DSM 40063]|uniref:Uncharacterized protein n=1 Tax=Streptomyces fradiae ATCC 10745 = DSM 40063 TaxID=1319510 RepID=A0A1Y2NPN7_STRFR|nr:hypothetical protein BG846_04928 [Streptomyces fradiae ATCC 10745 = DSM 40063]
MTAPTSWSPSRTGAVVRSTGTAEPSFAQTTCPRTRCFRPERRVSASGDSSYGNGSPSARECSISGWSSLPPRSLARQPRICAAAGLTRTMRPSVSVPTTPSEAARRIISVCRCERASSASVSTVPDRSRTTIISSSSPL